jgi:hypothetical protein
MKLTLKQLGIRRLGGNDIVRVGDLQWCDCIPHFDKIEDVKFMVITDAYCHCVGCQVCTEEVQQYANKFFRKLNAPKQT